ncbi:tetratricopeptide repeat protein [Primorskyibacter aestuariivivens]|uniref:tetratricopeptide repeat protein n=1 Tax=Primorskyibacter aestuariivivens TaxID=1888912 RepID=UPI0023016723|nr:tetratricopeptide repeat protein [Primorskyibacter aestuariivivens]MDA7426920.1 tetratricopeptide repeat protein [Primorskyibacter aestuariivivens]
MKARARLQVCALALALCAGAASPGWTQSPPAPSEARATLEQLLEHSERGHPEAQTRLAKRYATGDGVLPDFERAVELYRKAADSGHPEAQNQLGRHLDAGLGTPQDTAAALDWFGKAAAQGNPAHVFDYATVLEKAAGDDPDRQAKALATYARAAEMGHVPALTSLGVLYQQGTGTEVDYEAAARYFEKAVAAGDARALNNLGLLYVRGHGVEQDYDRAAQLFLAAAEAGIRAAMRNLAVMYENGFGVEQDDQQHAFWLAKAREGQSATDMPVAFSFDAAIATPDLATQADIDRLRQTAISGDPVAQFQMGWLLLSAKEARFATLDEARYWFEKAAARGHGAAMANLALFHAQGLTVPQNYERAYAWASAALATGRKDQEALLQWLSARMPRVQITAAQERAKSLWQPAAPYRPME